MGAFCGEAVVFGEKKNVPAHFITRIKQQGALLAKGRLLGIQFDVLFTDGLYERGTPCGRDGGGFKERVKTARLYVFP